MNSGSVRVGAAITLIAALAFASHGILIKLALEAGLAFWLILVVRYVPASGILWAATAVKPALRRPFRTPDTRATILTGATIHAIAVISFTGAVWRIGAGISTVLLYVFPAMVAVAMALMGREKLHAIRVAAIVFALIGVALISSGGTASGDPLGISLGLIAALANALVVLAGDRYVPKLGSVSFTLRLCLGGAFTFLVIGIATSAWQSEWPVEAWPLVLALILFPTIFGITGFMAGVARLGPAMASILLATEPIFAIILATVILSEPLGSVEAIGACLIIAAAVLMRYGDLRYPPAPVTAEVR